MSETREAPERQEGKLPAFRYSAQVAGEIEARWQRYWAEAGTFHAPNPVGPLSEGFDAVRDLPHLYVMDMFPYPSGSGLHVGHPLGYIGTDVFARYQRMAGFNVLHTMGYDAFGLPAEQYAVQTGQHPRVTAEANIANMRRQLGRLGLGHDERRSLATTDRSYYRWTQWIFLQIYHAWYDGDQQRARPIEELVAAFEAGRPLPPPADGEPVRTWAELTERERETVVDGHRLVYRDEVPVNWCPGLGTVLANEEVTADGRSERGNFPVYRRPLRQWMMRITAYADRLVADLDGLDWPEPIKLQQRNWIGRSRGARIWFPVAAPDARIEVFTTRPDTLFGATFMVLAPEHPLVDALTPPGWPDGTRDAWTQGAATPAEAVARYRETASRKSDLERRADAKDKTGVFTGSYARNPASGRRVPVFIADYVLMGYGTGAIMAVPDGDSRDFAFAKAHDLDILKVKQPPQEWLEGNGIGPDTPADRWPDAFEGDGIAVNSHNDEVSLDGLPSREAIARMTSWLQERGLGEETVTYRLRDWLFSRQRYWGEPFPIVYDAQDRPHALPDHLLPVDLPEITDYAPRTSDDEHADPETPLSRAEDWVTVELDLGDGPQMYRRETNTMPQWAGSCWYHLRYVDPDGERTFADPEIQRYWMGDGSKHLGGVDLYVGGVEHAVLHLLYARFWHKVLFDLGHVFQEEPFQRLYNQGYILAAAYTDERGFHVEASEVTETPEGFRFHGRPVTREYGKMGKSLKNAVSPDDMYAEYGADTLRLYEMFTGPLDQARPWETRAVVGVFRFLQRVWRLAVDEDTGELRVTAEPLDGGSRRMLHATIAAVRQGMEGMRFNTAIARLMELTTQLTTAYQDRPCPREALEPLVLMLAPLAPHVAEELWRRLGHETSLVRAAFPSADPSLLVEERMRFPVQVKGKVRATVEMAAGADDAAMELAAREHPAIAKLLEGREIRRVIVVPGRLVNFVTA